MPLPPTPPKGRPGTIRCAAGTSKQSAPEEVRSGERPARAGVVTEHVQRQRLGAVVDHPDGLIPAGHRDHREQRPRRLLPHYRVPGGGPQQGRGEVAARGVRSPPWTTAPPSARAAIRWEVAVVDDPPVGAAAGWSPMRAPIALTSTRSSGTSTCGQDVVGRHAGLAGVHEAAPRQPLGCPGQVCGRVNVGGDLPPSSRVTGVRFSAAARSTALAAVPRR